ncbi:hypothetical protein MPSEU_000088000 [Mayamaea pseudoterrestris]|nr:hypothetical protein MPSEU_000088000 [Mayamaea pseudoterrestris]
MSFDQHDLFELERSIMEAYLREADISTHFQRKSSSATLTVKDLELEDGKPSIRDETLKLEVLEAWRKLVFFMKKENVFQDYVENLSEAFKEVLVADKSLYRHLHTLTNLLINTAENKARDNSTECRFVTLLEVILSYGRKWSPSEEVSRFWVRLSQRIPSDVPAVNFRRKAYRVLVSLSWVPSSKGLLEACSFEESRQRIDPTKSPSRVRAQIEKIQDRPQPRFDCVNQVLDRLKDETDVRVAITSEREGLGKTTLAALVASHPSILRVFKVLWLNIQKVSMTYDRYTQLLDELCEQLDVSLEWPRPIKRFEESALKEIRDQDLMKVACSKMCEMLESREDNILLVLDDVIDGKVIDLFRFSERQSIIVTTAAALTGVDWSVELGYLSEEESIELFLTEAGFPFDHILGLTVEVRKIVNQCDRHPLTIRTVARWFRMKSVTAGVAAGMAEILQDLAHLKEVDDDMTLNSDDDEVKGEKSAAPFLFDVLSLALGPKRVEEGSNQTILFFMCLASMVAIFPRKTPLDTLLLLWEQLLKSDSHAVDEMSHFDADSLPPAQLKKLALKQAVFVAEGLTHMGIIIVSEENGNATVEVHHQIYRDFALYMAKQMDLAETYEETVQNWNKAFVTAYFTQQIQGTLEELEQNSQTYATKQLPSHIFKAKMFPIAETVLGESNFFHARIECMGWDRAVDCHIDDCFMLQQALNKSIEEETGHAPRLSPVFEQIASVLTEQLENDRADQSLTFAIAFAVCKIGIALAENGHHEAATEYLEKSWSMSPDSEELQAKLLYFSGWVQLCTNQCERALKMVRGSRRIIEDSAVEHEMLYDVLQLQADALVGECEYREALAFLVDTIETLRPNAEKHRIEFGMLLLKKSLVEVVMGYLDRAKASFTECVEWKSRTNETSRSLSLAHKYLGDIAIEQRKVSEAREHYENGLHVLDSLKIGTDDVDHLLLTGRAKILRKDWDGCIEALKQARHLIVDKPNVSMDQSAADLRYIARTYHQRGDCDDAVSVLQDSLSLTDLRLYSLERSAGLLELANVLLDQDQPSEGLLCLEQSLEISILKLGECVQLLDTLNAIGNVHLSLGAYEEALTVFYKVDELTRRIAPDDVERIAGVLYSIGEVHDAKKDFTEAVEKFNECMEVLRLQRSQDHPHIAKALQRLGDVTVLQKDYDTAYNYFVEALRIRKIDTDERNLAETMHSLGVLRRKQKQIDVAQETLLDALEIRQRLGNGRETGETLLELGNIYRLKGNAEDAISLYEKSLEVLEQKDDIRGSVYLALSHAQLSEGLDKKALKCCEQALSIRLAAYGKDNLKTGNVSRSLGIIRYLFNNGDEALVHLNEFVRVIEMNDDEDNEEEGDDVDYLLSVLLMFDIHKANGREEQARNLLEVAKDVCEESEDVREQLPELIEMTERRIKMQEEKVAHKEVEKEKKGLLARLNLSNEEGVLGKLMLEPSECETMRKIPFIDD